MSAAKTNSTLKRINLKIVCFMGFLAVVFSQWFATTPPIGACAVAILRRVSIMFC
jgi:hypothetical protein